MDMKCKKGCCTLKITNYNSTRMYYKRNFKKAGAFLYDPEKNKVLLVQSRGVLWGPPKGSLEFSINENYWECAIREVKEETGLDITIHDFLRIVKIKKIVYYYVERKSEEVEVQDSFDNDANAITWINVDCLEEAVKDGLISLNHHCKILLNIFLNKNF